MQPEAKKHPRNRGENPRQKPKQQIQTHCQEASQQDRPRNIQAIAEKLKSILIISLLK
jgi:hypothetical protein